MVVICCLAVVVAIAAAAARSHGPFPSPGRRDSSPPSSLSFPEPEPRDLPDLIVVPEEEPWLLSLAAPLAARLRQGDNAPLLLVSPQPPSPGRSGGRRAEASTVRWARSHPGAGTRAGEQFADLVGLWNPRLCLLLAASPAPPARRTPRGIPDGLGLHRFGLRGSIHLGREALLGAMWRRRPCVHKRSQRHDSRFRAGGADGRSTHPGRPE